MKTLCTALLLVASFWAGTHYVVTPRLEAAAVSAGKPSKKVASARPAPARKADRFDPGY